MILSIYALAYFPIVALDLDGIFESRCACRLHIHSQGKVLGPTQERSMNSR